MANEIVGIVGAISGYNYYFIGTGNGEIKIYNSLTFTLLDTDPIALGNPNQFRIYPGTTYLIFIVGYYDVGVTNYSGVITSLTYTYIRFVTLEVYLVSFLTSTTIMIAVNDSLTYEDRGIVITRDLDSDPYCGATT